MGILRDNQKTQIRYECEEVILYEPTKNQLAELKHIVYENTKMDLEKGVATTEYSYDIMRYIFKFYTTIGDEVDELTDDELEDLIENGNHKIQGLMRAITEMLREIASDSLYELESAIKTYNEQKKADELLQKANKLKKELEEKINVDKIIENQKEIEKLEKEKDIK